MQKVAKTEENLQKCKCMSCPSYTDSCKIMNTPGNILKLMENFSAQKHYEKMFCAFEKSHCIKEDKGCLCHDCEICKKYDLNSQEFCLRNGGFDN